MKHLLLCWLACAAIQLCAASRADGHGFAGPRFFPATLTTEDPFVADELSLPTISTFRTPDDGGTRETELSVEIAKRITPNFALAIGETFTALNPPDGGAMSGFGNLELGAKYQIPINERTGNTVGVIAQLHFYLDDLFPHSLGRPLFGGKP